MNEIFTNHINILQMTKHFENSMYQTLKSHPTALYITEKIHF